MGLLKATLVQHMGSDQMVADAARVSTNRDRQDRPIEGLIKYLAKHRHYSPFESCAATFMVKAPLFVRDQWVRHRTQSYNSLSLRYTSLESGAFEDLFYFPSRERPLVNEGSGAHPKFEKAPSVQEYMFVVDALGKSYEQSLKTYRSLLEGGVAEEVARFVLPEATMTRFYATANLRNWAAFVKERTADNAQWEIKQLALQVSETLGSLFPIAWKALQEGEKNE